MTTGARILIADDNPENLDILGTRRTATRRSRRPTARRRWRRRSSTRLT
jgi:hypothetical protein